MRRQLWTQASSFSFPALPSSPKFTPTKYTCFLYCCIKRKKLSPAKTCPSCVLYTVPRQGTYSNIYSLFLLTLLFSWASCFWPIILMPSLLLIDHVLFLSFKLLYSDSFSHLLFLQFTKICLLSLAHHWNCSC